MNQHPSYLKLDRLNLGDADEATRAHVGGCAQCQRHLGRSQQSVAVPAWARALPTERRTLWQRLGASVSQQRALAAIGALSCAAAVLLIAQPRWHESEDAGAKGAPSVAVYVKRGGQVSLWDGRAPLRAGDAVQLQVQPDAFTQIELASLERDGAQELYRGAVPAHGATLLPQSLLLDAAPTTLLLVFSRELIDAARLDAMAKELPRNHALWATRLALSESPAQ